MNTPQPFTQEQQARIDAALPIRTKRLALRRYTENDIERARELCDDPQVTKTTLNIPIPYTLNDAHEFYMMQAKGWDEGTACAFVIALKDTDEMIGDVGLRLWPAHKTANMGFYVTPSHWNKGYVTEAAHAALGFGFGVLDLNRIEAGHFAGNDASGKVQRKMGMTLEGIRRSFFVVKGQRIDDVLHAILREDYEPNLAKSIAQAKAKEHMYNVPS